MRKAAWIVLVCASLCAVAAADGPTGIYAYVTYGGNPQANDSIECWWKTNAMEDWAYGSTHSTTEQSWPPNYNVLRWAHSSQGDPKINIDTDTSYTFMAKSYAGGCWRYSEWSSAVYYEYPTTYASVQLSLTRTTDPGDPTTHGGGSK